MVYSSVFPFYYDSTKERKLIVKKTANLGLATIRISYYTILRVKNLVHFSQTGKYGFMKTLTFWREKGSLFCCMSKGHKRGLQDLKGE